MACGLFAYGTSQTPITSLVINGNELYDLQDRGKRIDDREWERDPLSRSPIISFMTMTTSASTLLATKEPVPSATTRRCMGSSQREHDL